jgi:hypothetical protein
MPKRTLVNVGKIALHRLRITFTKHSQRSNAEQMEKNT